MSVVVVVVVVVRQNWRDMLKKESNETTALFGTSMEGARVTFGTLPEQDDGGDNCAHTPSVMNHSFLMDTVHTEMSLEELRDSLVEGCCPGDSVRAGALGLLTAAVTPTMLSLPLAFSVGGTQFAFVAIGLCITLTMASVRILALASSSANSDDYETVAGFFFGHWCRWLTRAILFFYNFGCSVVYLRFIYDSSASVLSSSGASASLPPWLTGSSGPVIVLCIFVVCATPLSFNSRLASLRTNGFVSNVLVTFIVGAIIYRYFQPLHDAEVEHTRVSHATSNPTVVVHSWWKWLLPYFFAGPIFLFSYEVQSNVMSVFKDLHDPSPQRIRMCVCLALAGATLFYIPLGIFGAWSFPRSVTGNVLTNYKIDDDPLMLAAQFCCCFSAAVSFVFVLFPCRFAFFMLVTDGSRNKIPHALRVRIGILLSAVSCFLALFVPDVAMAVSVLGACCSSFLSMTLPALFSMKMRQSGTYCTGPVDTLISWMMLAGGVSFAVIGSMMSVFFGS